MQVVRSGLCTGCGACAAICPVRCIELVDIVDDGTRPEVDRHRCVKCGRCVRVCPGIRLSHSKWPDEIITQLICEWGPIFEVWEGYASDPHIRYEGSSGGVATALAAFCLEKGGFSGVLQIGPDRESPLQNVPVISRSRDELTRNVGSRYAPAPTCAGLGSLLAEEGRFVVVGKPCDIAATRKAQLVEERLRSRVGLALSIFCAGTPSTAGTYAVLDRLGVHPEDLKEIRYRGKGWPGNLSVTSHKGNRVYEMDYDKAWGHILSRFTQPRCQLCPDSTGEFADVACGDAWHRHVDTAQPGLSLILVRTELGRTVLKQAVKEGYITLQKAEPIVLRLAQRSLLGRRKELWGRLMVLRALGKMVPCYEGFALSALWKDVPLRRRARLILGTWSSLVFKDVVRKKRVAQC